jgi:hypothetical protein
MSDGGDEQVTFDKVKAIKKAYQDELMSKANVVGVGIGIRRKGGLRTDEMALVVMVERKVSKSQLATKDQIPAKIEGVPLDVQEVGWIKAQG